MKYSDLEDILKKVLPDATFHLSAPPKTNRYIIWAETGSESQYANNRRAATKYKASVYIYTQDENDNLLDRVYEALEETDIAFSDAVPAYDDELLTMGWIIECEFL